MKLERLSSAQAAHPEFEPRWRPADRDILAENPEYGAILHVAVCDEQGRPVYDQPAWAEPVGAIVVPVRQDGLLALVLRRRAIPAAADETAAHPTEDLSRHGRVSIELPRGFGRPGEPLEETARRETEEETGHQVESITRIGECNANTGLFLNNIPIFEARLGARGVSTRFDEQEPIEGLVFLSLGETLDRVRRGEIVCALTQAALLAHLTRRPQGTQQPDTRGLAP